MELAPTILLLNGFYDMVCAFCILQDWGPLSRLHASVFAEPLGAAALRFMAYWIFMYGAVRFVCGWVGGDYVLLGAHTYVYEALSLQYEHWVGKTSTAWKLHLESAMCVVLAAFVLYEQTI
jgi:hypothetical protein